MLISDRDVDVLEVLKELDIEVKNTRGEWVDALCPFHQESKPSFSVNVEHGGWTCRHDDLRGGLVDLYARVKDVSKYEAGNLIADGKFRSHSEEITPAAFLSLISVKLQDVEQAKNMLEEYNQMSTRTMPLEWFKRGFTWETAHKFAVRYDLSECRLVWPVRDYDDNVKGFITRNLSCEPKYKYLKGWSRMLFPLNHFNGDHAVLVEGPLDAMWLYQHGVTNALAILGADLTKPQERWLRSHVNRVTLMLDNDTVGKRSTKSLCERLSDLDLSIIELPAGVKDPQELPDTLAVMQSIRSAYPAVSAVVEGGSSK